MGQNGSGRALRPIAALAVLGVALGACGVDGGRPSRYYGGGYGGGYGGPGYYGSPYYGGGYGPYDRSYGSRGYYGGGYSARPPTQRFEGPGVQERLRQHWVDQMQRPR